MVRDFCSVNLDGTGFKLMDERQGTHVIRMSSDFSFYMDAFSNLTTPIISSLYDINGKLIRTLNDNSKLKKTMSDYAISTPEFFQFTNSTGTQLNGWILKPYNFDPNKKYPVLFYNYGGPGSQYVADKFSAVNFWHQYFQQNGVIVVSVDNRGTGFRGEHFKKQTYGQLGKLETEDQIDAAKYFAKQPYVDAKRIGHYGWSYGGFLSALAIAKGADVFSLAIIASPVSNWRYYDGIYTERYMGLPKDNPKGYDDNSPINHVDKIKGKVLITHGTGDDNVHFQNAAMMVKAMVEKGIPFDMAYYPNQAHTFRGMSSYHIYKRFAEYVLKNL
jgi:dipeptidyl-peptidase-4